MGSVRCPALTDCDGFDSDAFLEVGSGRVVGIFRLENLLSAECVDECRSACRSISQERSDMIKGAVPVPDAPQTISEKRTPFFTFFFLRIFICDERIRSVANMMAVSNWNDSRVSGPDGGDECGWLTYSIHGRRHVGCVVKCESNVSAH